MILDPHNPPAILMDEAAYVRRMLRWRGAMAWAWRACALALFLGLVVGLAWQLAK